MHLTGVLIPERLAAESTRDALLLRVAFLVFPSRRFAGEALLAHAALVRFLARVASLVLLETRETIERHLAEIADERPAVVVDHDVASQIGAVAETASAHVAAVGFLAGMRHLVFAEPAGARQNLPARLTGAVLHPDVNVPHVRVQRPLVAEFHAARVAPVHHLAFPQMFFQRLRVLELLPALHAGVVDLGGVTFLVRRPVGFLVETFVTYLAGVGEHTDVLVKMLRQRGLVPLPLLTIRTIPGDSVLLTGIIPRQIFLLHRRQSLFQRVHFELELFVLVHVPRQLRLLRERAAAYMTLPGVTGRHFAATGHIIIIVVSRDGFPGVVCVRSNHQEVFIT